MVQSWNPAGVRQAFGLLRHPNLALPHLVVQDIRQIDFVRLARAGIRGMAFDKDNCLTRPYEDHLAPELEEAWDLCKRTFPGRVLIVSNSAGTIDDPDDQKAKTIEQTLGVPVLRHQEKKPDGADAMVAYFKALDVQTDQLAMVGDRLLTDIIYGHRARALTILTRNVLSTRGDNWIAKQLRHLEHRWLDWVWPNADKVTSMPRYLTLIPHPVLQRLEKNYI